MWPMWIAPMVASLRTQQEPRRVEAWMFAPLRWALRKGRTEPVAQPATDTRWWPVLLLEWEREEAEKEELARDVSRRPRWGSSFHPRGVSRL
jgi:hypothetical protein